MEQLKQYMPAVIFTVLYIAGFSFWFLSKGNYEFIWYVAILIFFAGLVVFTIARSKFDSIIIWGLSIWGFLHMAGGGLMVKGDVLYNLILIPILDKGGEMVFLKYDQVVHFFGFAVATLVVYHLLRPYLSSEINKWVVMIVIVLAGSGLGVLNEIFEFMAVVVIPETNVGGYYNTVLDLIFNTLGSSVAALYIIWRREEKVYSSKYGMFR